MCGRVEKLTYLFVELNKGGFKLFVNVAANVVHVLGLGEWLAGVGLLGTEVGCWGVGHRVKWHFDILTVSVFFKLDVAHFFVWDDCGVVSGYITEKFNWIEIVNNFLNFQNKYLFFVKFLKNWLICLCLAVYLELRRGFSPYTAARQPASFAIN